MGTVRLQATIASRSFALNTFCQCLVTEEITGSKGIKSALESADENRLFAGSPDGAMASAGFFSLIETAKANRLEPYGYLRHIFKKLPLVQTEQDLKDLLPQNIVPDSIAVNN